jgi:uncharacterized protein (DUF3084 family)
LELQTREEKIDKICRERDSLMMEIGQLKSAGQHLDAWNGKVQELEMRHRDAEASARGADLRAQAAEKEQRRLIGEMALLEDKQQELQLLVATLREGAGTLATCEVFEPFTVELKERMQSLESRNSLLEQQLTVEGSQRVVELMVEVETLSNLRNHVIEMPANTSAQFRRNCPQQRHAPSSLKRSG